MPNKHSINPLRFSLFLLAVVVLIASAGLALDANWPKLLRVTLAAAAYLATLAAWSRSTMETDAPPWWPFACAGGLAGLISGTFQPSFSFLVMLTQAVAGALLLGTVHWLAVRHGRSFRDRLAPPLKL